MTRSWQIIAAELRAVPWSSLVWLLATVLVGLMVWQLTKHHYRTEWAKWAPEKARDELAILRRQLAEETRRRERLEAENAELRGRIVAARAGLTAPRHADVVEARQLRAVRR
jgi:hypothetical protein